MPMGMQIVQENLRRSQEELEKALEELGITPEERVLRMYGKIYLAPSITTEEYDTLEEYLNLRDEVL